MPRPEWTRLREALLATDPYGPGHGPGDALVMPSTLRRLAPRVGVRPFEDVLAAPQAFRDARPAGTIADVAPPAGRHALVLAHGPSLAPLLPAIAARRDDLFIVCPFRTALRLADAGVVPDVTVLADRSRVGFEACRAAWQASSPAVRVRIERGSHLLLDPFAPHDVAGGFARTAWLDSGFGFVPAEAQLPFWGYPLITALMLPGALGATQVAMAGLDLGGAAGPRRRTWSGAVTTIDAGMAPLLPLLGVVARGGLRLADVAQDSVAKPGVTHTTLARFLRRRPDETGPALAAAAPSQEAVAARLAALAARRVAHARDVALVATEALAWHRRLGDARRRTAALSRLGALLASSRDEWPMSGDHRDLLRLGDAVFLPALWSLADVAPAARGRREQATERTAYLVFSEVKDAAGRALELARDVRSSEVTA